MTVIALRTPISAHGEERHEIDLRDPTPGDMAACGYPIKGLAEGGGGPDPAVITKLIARLGNIPPGSVDRMHMRDWNACMAHILSFFGEPAEEEPEDGTSSTEPSTSRLSGNGSLEPRST